MKVILLKDVPNVGRRYEVKNVSDGYGRNFLIARGLGQIATTQAIQAVEKARLQNEQERAMQGELLKETLEAINGVRISISEKANEKGHLFAAVHKEEISKILKEQKEISIPAEMIEIEKPIKAVGEYEVKVKSVKFTLEVNPL